MRAKALIQGLVAAAVLSLLAMPAQAQQPTEEEMQKRMAKSMAIAGPGEEHQLLAKMVGTWDQEIKLYMNPGAEPMVMTGKATSKLILDGRFLQTESEGGSPPMVVKTFTLMGYDRRHERYTTIGMDTMGTYYVTAAGTYDQATRTLTLSGKDEDPVIGHTQEYDFVTRFESDNKYVWEAVFKDEMHTKGGDPVKLVEITYTRAQ